MHTITSIPQLFQTSHHLYYVLIRPDGYYAAANACFCERFQLTEQTISTTHSFETIHPDDHADCSAVVEQCMQHPGKSYPITFRKPLSVGVFTYTKWEFTYNHSEEEGGFLQCVGFDVSEEITQKTELENAHTIINNKQEMLVQMLSNCADVFILVNEQNKVFYCSSNIVQMLGFTEEEIVGKTGIELVAEEDKEYALAVFEAELLASGQNNSIDLRLQRKNGERLWVEVKLKNLFHNPNIKGMLINLNDISLRKQTEEILRNSKDRYKAFFNNLSLPLLVVSRDHTQILDVNEKAISSYGYSAEEFKHLNICNLFAEDISNELLMDIYNKNIVVEHRTKQGGILLVTISRHELAYAATNGYLLQITDVTETYRTQQENELGFEISDILIQPGTLKENLQMAIQKLRKFTKWDLSELWIPSFDGTVFRCEVADYDNSLNQQAMEDYFTLSNNTFLPLADYFDVLAINSIRPYWIEDITSPGVKFKLQEQLQKSSIKTALLIPVVSEKKVVCCLTLMSRLKRSFNRHELNLITTMANLFGAEISKRANSSMLSNFFLISRDILTIAGMDGRYIRVNPAFEEFSGYTAAEARSIHPLSYVHDFDKPAVYRKLIELSEGKSIEYFENRIITKDGITKWLAWTATPLMNEGIVIASHRDITVQKEMIDALAISNERYEYVKRATNEAIYDFDLKKNIILRSEGYRQLFDYDTDSQHTNLDFWESKLHPEDRERVKKQLEAFIKQSANNQWQCEYRFLKGDGTYAYISDKGFKIHNRDGIPIRVVGAMQDITRQKNLEKEIIEKEKTRQNQIAQAAVFAQEKERAEIGKELHDNIGQLLTTTKLYLEMLKANKENPEALIDRSTNHINSIIKEVRSLSRSLVPYSLNDLGLIASIGDLVDAICLLGTFNIEFIHSEEVEEITDKTLQLTIYRIIQEKLNNVIRHAEATNVVIELTVANGNVCLHIEDNGKGFDLRSIKKGQGILNIKSRAELHDGKAELFSNPGQGCKLSVLIPINKN